MEKKENISLLLIMHCFESLILALFMIIYLILLVKGIL